jgi:hypothetical protein
VVKYDYNDQCHRRQCVHGIPLKSIIDYVEAARLTSVQSDIMRLFLLQFVATTLELQAISIQVNNSNHYANSSWWNFNKKSGNYNLNDDYQ